MRRLAMLAGFAMAVALGFSGGLAAFRLADRQLQPAALALPEAGPLPGTAPEAGPDNGPWPPVFGSYTAPAAPEPEPEPEAPEPEPPPVVNLDFTLKGIFTGGGEPWAIVADGGGEEYLLRIGDTFQDYATVVEIGSEGVWLDTGGGREVIGFE